MNIKDYKEKEINLYIVGIIILYIFITRTSIIDAEEVGYINKIITILLESGLLYIFTYLADSIVSSYFKDKIIYLFGILKKPGECIFSKIKKNCKDDRIYKKDAEETYKEIYDNMPEEEKIRRKYENAKWYYIYSRYREEKMIQISNREYLMTRDFVFLTFIIFIIYAIFSLIRLIMWDWKFVFILVILLSINFVATHIKAKRFAYNVIAFDLARLKEVK